MKNKIFKTTVIILLLLTLTATNFIFLGSSVVSYAMDNVKTNHQNIEFSAYLKDSRTLKIDVNVKREGYFNGQIELNSENFKLKEVENNSIYEMKENTIILNQINAGEKAEMEIDVEPVREELFDLGLLKAECELNLKGTYKDSTQKDRKIEATRELEIALENNAKQEEIQNDIQILTNKVVEVAGNRKRVVQFSINLGLQENSYPIKEIYSKINIPEIDGKQPEITKIINLNNATTFDYQYKDGNMEVTLKNDATAENKVMWKENGTENIIITCLYDENATLEEQEIKADEKITFYDQKVLEKETKIVVDNEEKDGIIEVDLKTSEQSMYKGKIYAGLDREYTEKVDVKINLANVAKKVEVKEEINSEIKNIYFTKTELNREQFVNILGQDGMIEFRNQDGQTVEIVDKNSVVNEKGNFVVNFEGKDLQKLIIVTSAPVKEGTMEFTHFKTIKQVKEQEAKAAQEIATKVSITYNPDVKTNIATTSEVETKIELKEATTEATLEVNRDTLSTVVGNNVEMRATLRADHEQYNLFENSEITLELPEEVEKIKINSVDMVYENEMQIRDYTVEGNIIKLYLEGKQTTYKESAVEGTKIIINADVAVNKKSATNETNIKMTVLNKGETVVKESPIKVVAPKDITTIYSVKELGIETIGQEDLKQVMLAKGQEAKTIEPQFEIINNNTEAIRNVRILGTFPTNSETNNVNMKITEGITLGEKEGVKVYYSENEKATEDLANSENAWTEELKSAESTKKYLVVVNEMAAQESLQGSYKTEIPENLEYNQKAEQGYEVKYENSVTNIEDTLSSTKIKTETGIGPKVEVSLTAKVGGEDLADNAVVKNGEVIKYKVEVTNVGTEDVENVKVLGKVPEGTTLVEPLKNYEYTGSSYYKELENKNCETTIEKLKVGEVATSEYEVRVNKEVQAGTEIKNIAELKYGEVVKPSNEAKNITESAKVRASVKRVTDRGTTLYPTGGVQYFAIIENMTQEKQENVKVKTNFTDNLEVVLTTIYTGMESDEDVKVYSIGDEIDDIEEAALETENKESTLESEEIEFKPEINIGTLNPGEVKVISYNCEIKNVQENNEQINFSVVALKGKEETKSNKWEDNIKKYNLSLEMSTNTESKYVKAGDTIEYTIKVKNESDFEAKNITVRDTIPNSLTVNNVSVQGKKVDIKANSNFVDVSCNVPVEGETTIKIETVVDHSEARDEAEAISNIAYAEAWGEKVASTAEVNHIIEANKNSTLPDGEEDDEGENGENNGENNEENNDGNNGNNNGSNAEENDKALGTKMITGIAWFDENKNGRKDQNEKTLNNVHVKLLNAETNNLVKDKTGKTLEAVTSDNGVYLLENLRNGKYIVIFEYNKDQYSLTKYKADGISESENSDVMMNELNMAAGKQKVASTDIIQINGENISDINLGLTKLSEFDLKLDKYVSKILVQNKAGTVVKEFNDSTLAKTEIGAREINGTTVIIEYAIKVTNNGEVEGYAKKVADYIPGDLKFNSELNKDWYQADGKLYNTSLANEKIAAGESKTLKLTLTKAMTENNVGRTNNTAEIVESYNELGIADSNSTPGNRAPGENDTGSADVILSIRTGGAIYISIAVITVATLGIVAFIIIKKKKQKEEI